MTNEEIEINPKTGHRKNGGRRPGAGRKTHLEEDIIKTLKKESVEYALNIMRSKDKKNEPLKIRVVEKMLSRIIPQTTELTGKDGGPIETSVAIRQILDEISK